MRKRSRTLKRTRGKRVLNSYNKMVCHFAYAQQSENWREWTFRTISERAGFLLVSLGEAVAVSRNVDGVVQVVGFRDVRPERCGERSAATLTLATIRAVSNACAFQGSKPRLTRRERDEIDKFKVWPLVGDTKAVAVRPRISEDERREAEKLYYGPRMAVNQRARYTARQAA